jgi:hypothetical protein
MRFNKRTLPKTRLDLDKFVQERGLHAYGVVAYKGRDIFLAETELETDLSQYSWGYYQTSWFVNSQHAEEQFEGGSWLEFDAMHDSDEGWTPEGKRKARLAAAEAMAKDFINKCEQTV